MPNTYILLILKLHFKKILLIFSYLNSKIYSIIDLFTNFYHVLSRLKFNLNYTNEVREVSFELNCEI